MTIEIGRLANSVDSNIYKLIVSNTFDFIDVQVLFGWIEENKTSVIENLVIEDGAVFLNSIINKLKTTEVVIKNAKIGKLDYTDGDNLAVLLYLLSSVSESLEIATLCTDLSKSKMNAISVGKLSTLENLYYKRRTALPVTLLGDMKNNALMLQTISEIVDTSKLMFMGDMLEPKALIELESNDEVVVYYDKKLELLVSLEVFIETNFIDYNLASVIEEFKNYKEQGHEVATSEVNENVYHCISENLYVPKGNLENSYYIKHVFNTSSTESLYGQFNFLIKE